MFKINSESELLELLKIVSQEAVNKSRKTLNEAVDIAQERYVSNLRASENTYGVKLSEQEEEAPPEEPEAEETSPETETEEPEPEETEEPPDPETFGVSFDSVIKDINTLRAGRSTKDKEIKEELLGYYDRLDDGERKILHLFLRELSGILQGAITASDAQDPSENPFNAEITFPDEEPEESNTEAEPEEETVAEPGEESEEDSSPPIRVNERQKLNEIRKKVKRLMKRY